MKDTEPGGKLYDAAMQKGADVARKVHESDGPLHLDATEAATLKVILLGLQESLSICQQTNYAISAALKKQGLEIVREDNLDGTLGWSLRNKVQPPPETLN